jgi:NADH-quinone oxidoreductase subunit K
VEIDFVTKLSCFMFCVGALTVLVRRDTILMLVGIELMLNAVNLCLVGFSSQYGDLSAQLFVFFIMVVAAAESGIGLAIIISMFRAFKSVDRELATELKW